MEPLSEALRLLQRQAELEARMRKPGGIRVNEERELFQLRARLEKYPAAVGAVLEAAHRLHRPVDALSIKDVERVEEGIHARTDEELSECGDAAAYDFCTTVDCRKMKHRRLVSDGQQCKEHAYLKSQ